MNTEQQKAKEFFEYMLANPSMRFWQGLLNWSGLPFILVSNKPPQGKYKNDEGEEIELEDTYNLRFSK